MAASSRKPPLISLFSHHEALRAWPLTCPPPVNRVCTSNPAFCTLCFSKQASLGATLVAHCPEPRTVNPSPSGPV